MKKNNPIGLLVLPVFASLIALFILVFVFMFYNDLGMFAKSFIPTIMQSFNPGGEKNSVLVMGIDDTSRCTDTMFVVTFGTNDGKINIMHIPRDTRIKINGKYCKINSAYAKGKAGLSMQAASKLLGISVNSYVLIDTGAFRKIIDTLGGIYIDVPINMNYDDPIQGLNIHLNKGYQLLDGKKSEQYIRYRSTYSNGDIGRVNTQKEFLRQIVKQKLNAQYISKIDDIIAIVYKHVKTNISITSALKYAHSLSKVDMSDIRFFTLPGTAEEQNTWYYIPNINKIREIIRESY